MKMAQATYQDAELVLKLYDMRREERLRAARAWFTGQFTVSSLGELMEKCPPGSEHNAYFRQVTTYWDMAATFLVRGIINPELFFETQGEMLFVFEKIRPILEDIRKSRKNPLAYRNLELAAQKHIEWMNQNAPGAYEGLRAMATAQKK
jgi:hypothetical protein